MKATLRSLFCLILFFFILLFLLLAAGRILTPKSNRDWESYQAAAFYAEEPGTIDVLFLGDSVTSEGVSPMEMWNEDGVAAVVSAGPWFSICRSYYTLRDALKTQTPRLVVLETDALFAKDGASPLEDALSVSLEYYFPAVYYHDRWKELNAEDLSSLPQANWRSPSKGYNYQPGATPWPGGEYRIPSDEAWDICAVDRFFLNRIQKLCEEKGVPLLLMQLPCAATWRYPVYNAVKAYAQAHGLPFLDLNPDYEAFGLDWQTDTRDGGNHLNYSGARKVSLFLSGYLQERYDLPDRRGDARYDSWKNGWELYCDSVS